MRSGVDSNKSRKLTNFKQLQRSQSASDNDENNGHRENNTSAIEWAYFWAHNSHTSSELASTTFILAEK